jgi:hypothetical protein
MYYIESFYGQYNRVSHTSYYKADSDYYKMNRYDGLQNNLTKIFVINEQMAPKKVFEVINKNHRGNTDFI